MKLNRSVFACGLVLSGTSLSIFISKNRPHLRAESQFSRIEKFVGGLLSIPRTGCAPRANRKHTGKENMHASVYEITPLFERSYPESVRNKCMVVSTGGEATAGLHGGPAGGVP
jgi:hypothetical protein